MKTLSLNRLSLHLTLALWLVSLPMAVLNAAQITVLSAQGNWRDPVYNTTSSGVGNLRPGDPTASIDWGGPVSLSGYDFTKTVPGPQTLPPAPTPLFPLGSFTHRNQDLTPNGSNLRTLSSVKLDIILTLNVDGSLVGPLTFTFNFNHDETSNTNTISQCNASKLNPGSTIPCPDVVTFTASPTPTTFRVGGVDYTLSMSFVDGQGRPVAKFITEENQTNVANLVGQFNTPATGGGTNQAPTVNAGPDRTVTLPNTLNLSGTASDDGLPNNILTVNWTRVSGPGTVTFGNDQSLATTASFSTVGTYVLRLTASDTDLSSSDTMSVMVSSISIPPPTPVLTRIEVLPSSATLAIGDSHTFTAVAYDQNNAVMNGVLFNWSATGSNPVAPQSNSASTVLTAGNVPGTYQLTASNNGITGRAIIAVQGGVSSGVMWLVDPARATPNPVVGTQTRLHVLAQSTNPGPITYRWSVPNNNTMNILNPNANDTDVTFTQPGLYQFQVRMTDSQGLQLFSEVMVTVQPTAARVVVSPLSAVVQVGQNFQFNAQVYDQFDQPMNASLSWSSSLGTISGTGLFVSQQPGADITITARTSNGVSGLARITVEGSGGTTGGAFDLSQAKAYPVPYKSNSGLPGITFAGLGPDTTIRIFSTDGRLVETIRTNGPTVIWPVTNRNQEKVASWVYFYKIENSGGGKKEGKLVVIQ